MRLKYVRRYAESGTEKPADYTPASGKMSESTADFAVNEESDTEKDLSKKIRAALSLSI